MSRSSQNNHTQARSKKKILKIYCHSSCNYNVLTISLHFIYMQMNIHSVLPYIASAKNLTLLILSPTIYLSTTLERTNLEILLIILSSPLGLQATQLHQAHYHLTSTFSLTITCHTMIYTFKSSSRLNTYIKSQTSDQAPTTI